MTRCRLSPQWECLYYVFWAAGEPLALYGSAGVYALGRRLSARVAAVFAHRHDFSDTRGAYLHCMDLLGVSRQGTLGRGLSLIDCSEEPQPCICQHPSKP